MDPSQNGRWLEAASSPRNRSAASLRLLTIAIAIASLLSVTQKAEADEGRARLISYNSEYADGVEATAHVYRAPRNTDATSATRSAMHLASAIRSSGSTLSVVVAVQPHSCAPVYGTGGIPLSFSFSPVAAGDCVSFSAPAPVRPDPRPGQRRRPQASPEELARILADQAMSLAPEPELEVAPAQVGLTGLDSFFWLAEPPQPIAATAAVPGLQVTAEARPVQYVWDFGDGSDHVTEHPGYGWSAGRPGSIPHLYERRGLYDLGVEVIWEARWRQGDGEWQHLGYFSNADDAVYPVRQMVPVLTRTPR